MVAHAYICERPSKKVIKCLRDEDTKRGISLLAVSLANKVSLRSNFLLRVCKIILCGGGQNWP